MPSSHSPSRLSVMFDDDHAVADAGLALVAVLSEKLGLEELAQELVDIHPLPGRRVATLVHAMVAGRPSSTTPTCSARGRPRRCSAIG
jgi:hypothetical protein